MFRPICCDTCPYQETCEDYNDSLRSMGFRAPWDDYPVDDEDQAPRLGGTAQLFHVKQGPRVRRMPTQWQPPDPAL